MKEPPKFRFFAPDVSGDAIELPADEARHARHVLRLSGGEAVEVFDGTGGVVVGTFVLEGAASRSRKAGAAASVQVIERRRTDRPEPAIELAVAVPKGKRLDWLLEKAAELGAARLTPVAFERSVVRPDLSEHARQRWRGILVAACKQCESNWLPEVGPPAALAEYLAAATDGVRLLGDADAGNSVPEVLGGADKRGSLVRGGAGRLPLAVPPIRVLVGPEGGLTDEERSAAVSAGFVPVRVGRTVLRVETAAVVLMAAAIAWTPA